VDEETKADFQDMTSNSRLGAGSNSSAMADSVTNFDLAGWMAGKTVGGDDASGGGKKR